MITVGKNEADKQSTVLNANGFDISAASELMAIIALADDLSDLRNVLVGGTAYNHQGMPLTADDFNVAGAMTVNNEGFN